MATNSANFEEASNDAEDLKETIEAPEAAPAPANIVPDTVEECDKPAKKQRTAKQIAAYEKANKIRMENARKRKQMRQEAGKSSIRAARGIGAAPAEEGASSSIELPQHITQLKNVLDPFITLTQYQNACIEDLQTERLSRRRSGKRGKRARRREPSVSSSSSESDDSEVEQLPRTQQKESTVKKVSQPASIAGPIQRPRTPPPKQTAPQSFTKAQHMYSFMNSLGF